MKRIFKHDDFESYSRPGVLGLTPLEGIVLILTVVFFVGTLAWFLRSPTGEPVTITVSSTASDSESQDEDEVEAPGLLPGEVLDLNTVTADDLTRLPGIGEGKAEAIVTWREENGPFTGTDQLLEVKGIGEKILEKISPYITVGDPTDK